MTRKVVSMTLILAILFTTVFTACGKNTNETAKNDIRIASLKGPTSIGLLNLYDNNGYSYSIHGTADEITTGIAKGEIDIAAVPCNLASVLYNKTEGGITIAAINTLGVLYILAKGETITGVADLKGKTIYSTGQGTTPEYTLRYLLRENGIDPDKDVIINYFSEASEIVATVKTMDSAIVMLPQPYVTVAQANDSELETVIDITEEWKKIGSDSTVVTGVVIARTEFVNNNGEAFEEFLKEYEESVEFANTNIEECANLCEKFDIFKAAIASKAIPYCNVTFIKGEEMKSKILGYLNVLYNENPKSIGGSLPDDKAFYIGE